jgi:hypothetical protein
MPLPDFDTMARLASENPEELERIKRDAIEELINSAPPSRQARLRGLQWSVDQKVSLHKCPLGSLIEVNKMMWDSFEDLRKVLNGISALK